MSTTTHTHVHSEHNHSHFEADEKNGRALFAVFILTFSFMFIEFIGGILTNSLALVADAGHMLTDSAALGMSLFAFKIAQKPKNESHSFGYSRAEVVSAFTNGLLLLLISAFIIFEALERLNRTTEIDSIPMFVVAVIGLIINIVSASILFKVSGHNLNTRGAFLHVISDMLGSIGAITAAIIIFATGMYWVDSVISLFIVTLIVLGGVRLIKESLHILMEGRPKNLNPEEIELEIKKIEGVVEVHDLHLWTITSNVHNISCHVIVQHEDRCRPILTEIQSILTNKFNLNHSTIQIEHYLPGEKKADCNNCC